MKTERNSWWSKAYAIIIQLEAMYAGNVIYGCQENHFTNDVITNKWHRMNPEVYTPILFIQIWPNA